MAGATTTPHTAQWRLKILRLTDPIIVQPYRLNTTLRMAPRSEWNNMEMQLKGAKAFLGISPLQLLDHDLKFKPSCLNMQLADPPIRLLNMVWEIWWADWDGRNPTEARIHTISQPNGVRFGHLVETFHLDELEDLMIPPSSWIEVADASFPVDQKAWDELENIVALAEAEHRYERVRELL